MVGLSITNGFRTETMYVYYIAMEIYVFDCMNIFSPFYCLCTINMSHHLLTMNFPWTTPKTFQSKISTPFTILFHKISHSYNNFFLSKWRCFQRSQTPIYILTKRKLNKEFSKVYTSHGSPCDFTCIIKCKDFSHDFHIN
jgi:hypothetical protein